MKRAWTRERARYDRLAVTAAAAGLALLGRDAAAGDAALPRYDLEVGQKITYATERLHEMEIQTTGSTGTWTVWVVDRNPDGTWRLVARAESHSYAVREGARREISDQVWFAWFDLRPDGRYLHNPSLGFSFDPSAVFVPLPLGDEELAGGWEVDDVHFSTHHRFRLDPAASPRDAVLRIESSPEAANDDLYIVARETTIDFDRRRGLAAHIERRATQQWSRPSSTVSTMRLVGVESVDPAEARRIGAEAEAYFDLETRYDEAGERAERDLGTLEAAMEAARSDVAAALDRFTVPELRAKVEDILEEHERKVRYRRSRAERLAAVMDKPAPDWTLEDLDGKAHSLASHRGEVVILDFWYRGCGWCLRAMPQVKRLASDLAGEPVAIFGMNTDEEVEDARLVADAMHLDYPSLRATGIPESYHVQAFPTLMIIDQQGIVRGVHVGYTPDLYEKVRGEVMKLLAGGS